MSERSSSSAADHDGGSSWLSRPSWSLPGPARSRLALTAALVVVGLILVFTVGTDRDDASTAGPAGGSRTPASTPRPQPTVPPDATAAPVDRPAVSDEDELEAWSHEIEDATAVPARAAAAYGRAEMWLRGDRPGCHLSWSTLAAIGHVETRHGSGGSTTPIRADGRPTKPIVGPPLDGAQGRARVRDTDAGRLDGDSRWDRALGPMGFLPAAWERWADRATRDGQGPDPQDIDDAALTAARQLCGGGRDLATAAGWWAGVTGHNGTDGYGRDVAEQARTYAERAPADR